MPSALNIPSEQLVAFTILRDLGPDGIEHLASTLRGRTITLHVEELQQALAPALGANATVVAEVLVGLSLLQRQGRSAARVVEDLTETLMLHAEELDPAWSEADFERWSKLQVVLEALLTTEPVLAVGKALDLRFAHANVLADVQVVTDLRPVFDSTGDEALAAMISHTLCLRYSNEGRAERCSIALDHADLTNLMRACERALKKEGSLKAKFGGLLRVDASGDSDTSGEVPDGAH